MSDQPAGSSPRTLREAPPQDKDPATPGDTVLAAAHYDDVARSQRAHYHLSAGDGDARCGESRVHGSSLVHFEREELADNARLCHHCRDGGRGGQGSTLAAALVAADPDEVLGDDDEDREVATDGGRDVVVCPDCGREGLPERIRGEECPHAGERSSGEPIPDGGVGEDHTTADEYPGLIRDDWLVSSDGANVAGLGYWPAREDDLSAPIGTYDVRALRQWAEVLDMAGFHAVDLRLLGRSDDEHPGALTGVPLSDSCDLAGVVAPQMNPENSEAYGAVVDRRVSADSRPMQCPECAYQTREPAAVGGRYLFCPNCGDRIREDPADEVGTVDDETPDVVTDGGGDPAAIRERVADLEAVAEHLDAAREAIASARESDAVGGDAARQLAAVADLLGLVREDLRPRESAAIARERARRLEQSPETSVDVGADLRPDGGQHDPLRAMVDIETLGLDVGCPILSIGAVLWTVDRGIVDDAEWSVTLKSNERAGLITFDAETLQWWLKQDDDAQECLTGGDPLPEVLDEFARFVCRADEVWANSPKFDASHLERAFDATDKVTPWNYSQLRDVRTIRQLAVAPKVDQDGTEHDALDDARYQVRGVRRALQAIREDTRDDPADLNGEREDCLADDPDDLRPDGGDPR